MHKTCECCGSITQEDIIYRLSVRAGKMEGNGWSWQKKDLLLMREAIQEIEHLRDKLRKYELVEFPHA